ncbi:tetratricopeptide repeat protein [Jiella sonneratiae]|uniref:Tetratricopeptide repeat protein n=1 Tax=Jiella sonneratiae TaxID=2816856 RepID=A0ABS3IYL1_9HYPH|nr:tetratricopeptide repeat protein [Jiella sonneratiae]MBO0902505.1 tetratricopeptide repeat protein [Jiella sonneratiae]
MRSEVCEKMSTFCTALFGVATATSLGVGTGLLGLGATALAIPIVVSKLRAAGARPEPHPTMVRLERALVQNFDAWARTGDISPDAVAPMEAALAAVLPKLSPSPELVIRTGRDSMKLARLVVTEAARLQPGDFAESADPQHGVNRRALVGLLLAAIGELDGKADFENVVMPWFQREVLSDLKKLGSGQKAIQADVAGLHDRLDALPQKLAEEILKLLPRAETEAAAKAGIPEATIVELARRIAADVTDGDRALRELERAVAIAIEVQEDAARGSNTGAFVDEVLRRMAALSAEGRYDEASSEADRAFADWQAAEEERRQEASARGIRILRAGVRSDMLRRDARSVAQRFAEILDLETNEPNRFEALRRLQDEWYVRGRDQGLNLDLEVSIELARIALARAVNPDQRGAVLNDFAISLQELGQRETGTRRLEEAVAAYRAALEEYTRERAPLDWAATHNNLGTALQTLGERETGTARLEEAVVAYRAALEERTRERVPLDWAVTQNNLGNALRALGERETGTARLEEAVAAYRAALEERTRERVPLGWAMTQNNLGIALKALGQRETGTGRLEEAVTAYHAALEERTRERVPLDWAMTQNNLGNALQALGERETGTGRLEEAVVAYRAALEEYTRDRVPLDWAATQNNLGAALQTLGARETGTLRLEEAVAAYRAALEERTRERVPFLCAQTRENMAIAYLVTFDKTGDRDHLDAALEAVADALGVYREARSDFFVEKAERLRAAILSRTEN